MSDDLGYGPQDEIPGEQLAPQPADLEDTDVVQESDAEREAIKKKKKMLRMMVPIGAIALFGLLGVLFFGGKGPAPAPQQEEVAPLQPTPSSQAAFEPSPTPPGLQEHPLDQFDPAQSAPAATVTIQNESAIAPQPTMSREGVDPALMAQVAEALEGLSSSVKDLKERVAALEKNRPKQQPFYKTVEKKPAAAPAKPKPRAKPVTEKESATSTTSPTATTSSVASRPAEQAPAAGPGIKVSVDGYRLKGVMPGMAWIAGIDGRLMTVNVGDVLPGGAVVQSIDAERHMVMTTAGGIQ